MNQGCQQLSRPRADAASGQSRLIRRSSAPNKHDVRARRPPAQTRRGKRPPDDAPHGVVRRPPGVALFFFAPGRFMAFASIHDSMMISEAGGIETAATRMRWSKSRAPADVTGMPRRTKEHRKTRGGICTGRGDTGKRPPIGSCDIHGYVATAQGRTFLFLFLVFVNCWSTGNTVK